MPENSTEYRCLVATKGKDEIEKRKKFLINTSQNNENQGTTTKGNEENQPPAENKEDKMECD